MSATICKSTIILLIFIFLSAGISSGKSIKQGVHGEKTKLPNGCGSCHKGHGVRNTPLLTAPVKDFCFECHGYTVKQEKAVSSRRMARGLVLKDIESEFKKPFHHPIEIQGVHNSKEVLPERDASTARHSTCMDCHNPHRTKKDKPLFDVSGARNRTAIRETQNEYEVCYKCHSYSANLPGDQKNKEEEFDLRNRSYHPIEGPGRNTRVPSLIPPLTVTSTIKCSDCHSSSGFGAPKGPHGSIYDYILKKNYSTAINTVENVFNFELCYDCHRRESLLGNVSWQHHSRHINITSCRTCHNSHGSQRYPYLIDFNPLAVSPNREGRLDFVEYGEGSFDCFLKCHNVDHGSGGITRSAPAMPFKKRP